MNVTMALIQNAGHYQKIWANIYCPDQGQKILISCVPSNWAVELTVFNWLFIRAGYHTDQVTCDNSFNPHNDPVGRIYPFDR